jgi:hypothetical protein
MDATSTLVMSFASLDDAESALDWIGVDFVEADDAFEGVLTADDLELLDRVEADPDSPATVRDLAAALRHLLDPADPDGEPAWRVDYEA